MVVQIDFDNGEPTLDVAGRINDWMKENAHLVDLINGFIIAGASESSLRSIQAYAYSVYGINLHLAPVRLLPRLRPFRPFEYVNVISTGEFHLILQK